MKERVQINPPPNTERGQDHRAPAQPPPTSPWRPGPHVDSSYLASLSIHSKSGCSAMTSQLDYYDVMRRHASTRASLVGLLPQCTVANSMIPVKCARTMFAKTWPFSETSSLSSWVLSSHSGLEVLAGHHCIILPSLQGCLDKHCPHAWGLERNLGSPRMKNPHLRGNSFSQAVPWTSS